MMVSARKAANSALASCTCYCILYALAHQGRELGFIPSGPQRKHPSHPGTLQHRSNLLAVALEQQTESCLSPLKGSIASPKFLVLNDAHGTPVCDVGSGAIKRQALSLAQHEVERSGTWLQV